MEYIQSRQENGAQTLALKGEWTVSNAADIESAIARHRKKDKNLQITIDARDIKKLDTAGAWLIRRYFTKAQFTHFLPAQKKLMDFVPEVGQKIPTEKKNPPAVINFFIKTGEASFWLIDFIYGLFTFVGVTFVRLLRNIIHPSHFRLPSIARHIYETGVQALPIICLMAFGISMVISYQGAIQLQKFGADIFTIDLTVISLLREMAVLTTAIMVAGRSGSAFAAEIGVMKMRGEVDALKTMGLDPIETLVIPRFLALLITLPALSFIADITGLVGGGFMAITQLDISAMQYISRVQTIATPTMFFIGMIKAPVFALLITAVCTYQGMSASGSAENVGKITTMAVVQSIFLVILADAVFSIVFAKAGI